MAFTLAPGEEVRAEIELEGRGGGLFFTPSFDLRVTNFRFSVTESLQRGSETTKYVPLEHINYVQEGKYSTPRNLWIAIACAIIGVVAAVTVIGIIIAIPLFIASVVFFFRYLRSRAEGLVVGYGGQEDITIIFGGHGRLVQEIIEALEAARLNRTAQDYYASAIASKTSPALPGSQ